MEGQQPQAKEFGLSQQELTVIQENNRAANAIMGVFLSYLAVSRFGYAVTQNTRFEIKDGRLFISEDMPQAQAENDAAGLEMA